MNRDLNEYQKLYQKQQFESFQVNYRKRLLLSLLNDLQPKNILEVGCGLESIILDYNNFNKAVIVEPSKEFYLKVLNDSANFKNKEIIVLNSLLEDVDINIKTNNFDCILVSSLLHEIPDMISFLNIVSSLAQKNTIIHFNVPNVKSFHRLLALEMGLITSLFEKSQSNIDFQQFTNFDLESLCKLLNDFGFQIIQKGSYSIKPFTHGQMQLLIDNNIIDEMVLDGLYNMIKYFPDYGSEIFVNVKLK
jgi:hypothetical protein